MQFLACQLTSDVRAFSIWVPLQCGTRRSSATLQLPPSAVAPTKPDRLKGAAEARGAPKKPGCGPAKSSGMASDTAALSRTR
jgi:hypothetical protein